MENLIDRELRGIRLKTMKKLFNLEQKANPFVILMICCILRSSKFSIQNRRKNFENFNLFPKSPKTNLMKTQHGALLKFKYQNKQIQVKKFQYLSKIGKFLSLFDFHIKSRKQRIFKAP
jgi:hypothetical protein